MVMELVRITVLLVATMATGIMAGVMFLYSIAIMPGLRRTDDRTFVGAFQQIDTAIINPAFLAVFMGNLLVLGGATALHVGTAYRSVLPWIVVAATLYFSVVAATLSINVPRNDEIKAAGDPDKIADLARVRARFNESRWLAANHFRTAATTAAFGCLAWALVLLGRVQSESYYCL